MLPVAIYIFICYTWR